MCVCVGGGGGGELPIKVIYTCAPPFIGKIDKFLAPFMG